jgi:hypothetical protein
MENEPVRRVRVRRSREEIAEMIEEYCRSGQMQGEYCRGRRLSVFSAMLLFVIRGHLR